MFADARLRKWLNLSGNVGYIYNSSVKGSFPNGDFTLLDRPDELQYGVGVDFPTNKFFQPILEFKGTRYVAGRTPNAFENNPMDGIAGLRVYPRRWFGFGVAYRYHFNQQDNIDDTTFSQNVNTFRRTSTLTANPGAGNAGPLVLVPFNTVSSTGPLSTVYPASTDPHGFIFQFWAGRRNARTPPPVPNIPADVTGVTLDSTTVVLPCPPGRVPRSGTACNDDLTVGVKTDAKDAEGDVLTYSYTVSGGRIVGQGANVNWDLSGVRPGTYTIISAVDDGCGFCGKTQTKTITVTQCDCVEPVRPCACPTSFTVSGPSDLVEIGATATFTANVSGGSNSPTYNWSVSSGTITSGQGTPAITVEAAEGATVTATVELGGLCADCNRTGSATANWKTKTVITSTKIDEFGEQKPDQIKARLDSFFIALNNDPTATGYIINYGPAKLKAARIKVITAAIAFRKFDKNRIVFVDGGEGELWTEFWLQPQGATAPTPDR
jgi:hypothetical protein